MTVRKPDLVGKLEVLCCFSIETCWDVPNMQTLSNICLEVDSITAKQLAYLATLSNMNAALLF